MPQKYPDVGDFKPDSDQDRIDPWVNIQPNCKTQTGGDWYRLFLSASLGKKIIHGVNTAPSMEVLGKVPNLPDENMAAGFIRWDDRTVKPDLLGSRISDKFYAGHHYRGGQTKSGAFVAFDEGSWEPSLRTRARSSAILAAGIAAHGCDRAAALKTTSIITSDEVDAEAVAATLLPAAHLKREMTTVAKTSHLVFSQGTLQQGITWDDSRISLDQYAPHVAYDWGRITAIARYIAEANIQICPRFREAASGMGIAYHLARNAWAEVSSEDFQLHPDMFANVPRVDLKAVGVPSIKGAYLDHDQEVFVAFTRFLATEPVNPTSDAYRGLVHLQKTVRSQQSKRQKLATASIAEIEPDFAEVQKHSMSDAAIKEILKVSKSPLDLLAMAVKTKYANDVIFRTTIDRFLGDAEETTVELLDHTCKLVYHNSTWIFAGRAAKEEADKISDASLHGKAHELLVSQLSRLKSDLFGIKTHLETTVMFTPEVMTTLRENVRDLIARSRKSDVIPRAPHYEFQTQAVQDVSNFVASLGSKAGDILTELRSGAAKAYKKAAVILRSEPSDEAKQNMANYLVTSVAIKTLGLRTCLLRHTGYIDGSVPKETYVYKAAKKLHDNFSCGKPKLKFGNHINASLVAEDLELTGMLGYSMQEAVAYATNVLDQVIAEMTIGRVYKAPEELMDDALECYTKCDSPKYDTQDLDEEAAMATLEALTAEADEIVQSKKVDTYMIVLNSYPTAEMADNYAQLNGYPNFRAAYDDIGFGAEYNDENQFVLLATSRLPYEERREKQRKAPAKKGYQPML